MRLRQIHKPHGDLARQPVTERLPFGREDGERIKDRALRLIWRVDQQRDRRLHLPMRQQRQRVGGVGRAFNKKAIRPQCFQRLAQAAR